MQFNAMYMQTLKIAKFGQTKKYNNFGNLEFGLSG